MTADLRGHGESSVDWPEYSLPAAGADILALIDHLGGGPAHFIGTSFTPGAAVWAAAERPEAGWIVAQLPAELLLVEGAGHYPQTEMPEKVTPAVLAFLGRVGN